MINFSVVDEYTYYAQGSPRVGNASIQLTGTDGQIVRSGITGDFAV